MSKYGLNYFTDIHLTLIALVLFFVWFLLLCFWVYKLLPTEHIKKLSLLPLTEDEGRRHE